MRNTVKTKGGMKDITSEFKGRKRAGQEPPSLERLKAEQDGFP